MSGHLRRRPPLAKEMAKAHLCANNQALCVVYTRYCISFAEVPEALSRENQGRAEVQPCSGSFSASSSSSPGHCSDGNVQPTSASLLPTSKRSKRRASRFTLFAKRAKQRTKYGRGTDEDGHPISVVGIWASGRARCGAERFMVCALRTLGQF